MRHRVYGKHLSRDKNQRTALFRGLIRSLILSQSITTTETKAKAIKGFVDQLINKARENTEASRRVIYSNLPQKEISKKLIEEIAPLYKERTSGFTQTVRLGRRAGDGTMLVRMSLIQEETQPKAKAKESKPQEAEEEVSSETGKPAKEEKKELKKVTRKAKEGKTK